MTLTQRLRSPFAALALAILVAGCGSTVKLDEIPVLDAKGTQVTAGQNVQPTTPQGTQTGVPERPVQAVNVGSLGGDTIGPTGIGRVILFDYDSFDIKPEYRGVIDSHARYLTTNKTRKLAIEGHTDERGGREYNLALGQKRAESVRRALTLLGVPDAQMEAVSFGEEKPADGAITDEAFAKNRRAEMSYR
jgi:peptidoglycan-associated lipoprotein